MCCLQVKALHKRLRIAERAKDGAQEDLRVTSQEITQLRVISSYMYDTIIIKAVFNKLFNKPSKVCAQSQTADCNCSTHSDIWKALIQACYEGIFFSVDIYSILMLIILL